MATATGSLDYWRTFFRTTDSDIIEVIESAILVATSDYPKKLRSRRDQITEKLYACRCFDCDRAEQLQASEEDGGEGEKESKASSNSSGGGAEELNRLASNYSYNEAEALTEEIEEQSETVGEVLRIKELLANHQDESDNVLFESMRRLQLMDLSVDTLKATDIGRAVNGLRRHNSKQIRLLVRTLIEDWKVLVDEWVSATAAIANSSQDSVSPIYMDQEEGLPSPPLDEGALWATQTTSIQLSEFFDGMDDDGNFRISGEVDENRKNGNTHPKPERKQQSGQMRRQEPVIREVRQLKAPNEHANHQDNDKGEMKRQESVIKQTKPQAIDKGEMTRQEPVMKQTKPQGIDKEEMRRQEPIIRQRKPLDTPNGQAMSQVINNKQSSHTTADAGTGRPTKPSSERRASCEMNAGVQKKPPIALQDKLKNFEEASLQAKLEVAKRKLHKNYQQAENAKKQRTIQVMELHDIPKKAHINKPILKSKSHIRNRVNGWH